MNEHTRLVIDIDPEKFRELKSFCYHGMLRQLFIPIIDDLIGIGRAQGMSGLVTMIQNRTKRQEALYGDNRESSDVINVGHDKGGTVNLHQAIAVAKKIICCESSEGAQNINKNKNN